MSTTSLTKKVFHTIQEDGIGGCVKKTNGYIKKEIPGKTSERTTGSYELYNR